MNKCSYSIEKQSNQDWNAPIYYENNSRDINHTYILVCDYDFQLMFLSPIVG